MAQPSPPAVRVPQPPHTGPPSCGQSYCPIAQALLVMLSHIPSPTGLRLAAMAKRHVHCGERTVAQCGATWHSCPLPRARWSRSPWKGMWFSIHPAASEGRGLSSSPGLWLFSCLWSVQWAAEAPAQRVYLLSWNGAPLVPSHLCGHHSPTNSFVRGAHRALDICGLLSLLPRPNATCSKRQGRS